MTTKQPMALADFPEWGAETDKLIELQLKLNDNAEKQRLHPPEEAVIDRRSRDATELLDGVQPDDGPEWADQLQKLQAEGHVLETAIKIHRDRMGALQTRLSKQICEPLVRQHKENVAAVILAVQDLAQANAVESELRRQLELGDVLYLGYLRPMSYKRVGRMKDTNSDISLYLKEAVEFGFMEPDKDAAA